MITVQKNEIGRERAGQTISVFARRLLKEWNRLQLSADERPIVVAVSGGADSAALLLGLDELIRHNRLSSLVTVAHLNHGLREKPGEEDAVWVSGLAESLGHNVALEHINVRELLKDGGDNLEQAARHVRYKFLLDLAVRLNAMTVLTAHTMNDQAETVLLRLMRGSGVEGLGGMNPVRVLSEEQNVLLVRPLLRWARRVDTENYCHEHNIAIRVDAMNTDESFSRVRVRKQLLPLMKTFNGRIVETLSRTARLLQNDSSYIQTRSQELLQLAGTADENGVIALRIEVLAQAHASVRRRALREWITQLRGNVRRLELVHVMAVEKLVFGERGGRVAELPGGAYVERTGSRLVFHTGEDDPNGT